MENIVRTAKQYVNYILSSRPFYKHNSLIICGENGSGKTTLIKYMIKELLLDKNFSFYYIDPQNRMIYDENKAAKSLQFVKIRSIVANRVDESNFMTKDVFDDTMPGTAVVYRAIIDNFDMYKTLFEKELGIEIILDQDVKIHSAPEIVLNGGRELSTLSSSETARMRLLFEINYAVGQGAKLIIIDEFDTYLSEDTTQQFLELLYKKYNNTSFIVSINTLSSLLQLTGFDGAIICDANSSEKEDNVVRLIDIDSIKQLGQIEKIKRMIKRVTRISDLEEIVSHYVDTNEIRDTDILYLKDLGRDELSGREKILYDYAKKVMLK